MNKKVCSACGKTGIFLKLYEGGLCMDCYNKKVDEEFRQRRQAYRDAGAYAMTLKQLYEQLTPDIVVDADPIKAPDSPALKAQRAAVNELLSKLVDFPQYPKLQQYLTDHKEEFKSYSYWSVPNFIDYMNKRAIDHDKKLQIIERNLREDAAFHKKLISIPRYDVAIVDCEKPTPDKKGCQCNKIDASDFRFKLGDFVAIDVETTGLDPGINKIIAIAAIRFETWYPEEVFETMVNPGIPISEYITKLTGITDDMVQDAPKAEQVFDSLNQFIGDSNLVGHNLPFDIKFLRYAGFKFNRRGRKCYDTYAIAKDLLTTPRNDYYDDDEDDWDFDGRRRKTSVIEHYDVVNYKLPTLCAHYHIHTADYAHRADADCLSAGLLFDKLTAKIILGR
ncbi:MAG: 3'-5' exonuclease [Clostridiales bacterium]|nr:3'-5' exonuclease [Clostridiales bacterium]